LSIGFETVKSKVVDGVRHLSELRLWEVSLVTFAANPQALVTGVKSDDQIRAFRALLAECKRAF
jgi:HK97 family phage prohead protease